MDLEEISASLHVLWENRPEVVVLMVLGFFVFLFLAVDAWRHRRRRKRPR